MSVDVVILFGHRPAQPGRWHLVDGCNIAAIDGETGAVCAGFLLGDHLIAQHSVGVPRWGRRTFFPPEGAGIEPAPGLPRGWYVITPLRGRELLGFSRSGEPPFKISLPPVSGGWLKYTIRTGELSPVRNIRFNRRSRRLYVDGNLTDEVAVQQIRKAFGLPDLCFAGPWGPAGLAQRLLVDE